MQNLITIKQAVKEVLEESPKSRNSKEILYYLVCKKFGVEIYMDLINLSEFPKMEAVFRVARDWQNKKGFFPPSKEIDNLRIKKEIEYKEVFR